MLPGQSFDHQPRHRQINQGLTGGRQFLIIFGQAPGTVNLTWQIPFQDREGARGALLESYAAIEVPVTSVQI